MSQEAIELFKIKGQMGVRAVRNLVRAQEIMTDLGSYNYVEIGSYLGRTLQPHIDNPACKHILSIDLRPDVTDDERGPLDMYKGISEDDMLALLAEHCTARDLKKLDCVTDSSDCLKRRRSRRRYQLALIDGEHTITAAFRDFLNLMQVMDEDAIVLFDDTPVILPAVMNVAAMLEAQGKTHHVAYCRGGISVVGLGAMAAEVERRFDETLLLGEDVAQQRFRTRITQSSISLGLKHAIRHEPGHRNMALRILRRMGFRIEEPTEA